MSIIFKMNRQLSFRKKEFISGPEIKNPEAFLELLFKTSANYGNNDETDYFSPEIQNLKDPKKLKDLELALKIINRHLEKESRIMIYGDFDTDGITSTVILTQGLRDLGAQVSHRIPNRVKHSHGLNLEIIDEIVASGTQLIITCDCGINDQIPVKYAQEKGLEVIITDHHHPNPKQKTSAQAVLNPLQKDCAYSEKFLSGSALAFKLIQALAAEKLEEKVREDFYRKYLEIAAIGVIGDCVPLQGENRMIAILGIKALKNTQWPGLKEALKSETTIDENTISFNLAPKLNAASRLGDVQHAIDLFMGKKPIAQHKYLVDLNEQRKFRTQEIAAQALSEIKISASGLAVIYKAGWEVGILGLVASKITERYGTPSFVGTQKDNGNWGFSVRSTGNFSVIKALRSCEDIFEKMGGHDGAAGFEIQESNLEKLHKRLEAYAQKNPFEPEPVKSLAVLNPNILNLELLKIMQNFKPFGAGNPEPVLEIKKVQITDLKILGKEQNHLKIIVEKDGKSFEVLGFFKADLKPLLASIEKIDLFFTLTLNEFRGVQKLQLKLVDFKA